MGHDDGDRSPDHARGHDAPVGGAERHAAALAARVVTAGDILRAAELRDHRARDRDDEAAQREGSADRAAFLSPTDAPYGYDSPGRRHAALDRRHAEDDRGCAAADRRALTRDLDEATASRGEHPRVEPDPPTTP